MPYPRNLETAKRVEQTVREGGAIPATIAIINHKCCIGLNNEQLNALAQHGFKCAKVSRRDILPVLASGEMGATTVAGTCTPTTSYTLTATVYCPTSAHHPAVCFRQAPTSRSEAHSCSTFRPIAGECVALNAASPVIHLVSFIVIHQTPCYIT